MQDLRQSPQYAEYMEKIGWRKEFSRGIYAYVKKIPALGIFIKLQRPLKLDKVFIDNLVNKYKPFKFVVEPTDYKQAELVKNMGFRQMRSYFVPSKTVRINLKASEESILNAMHYKTRYNIKKSMSSTLSVETSIDIGQLAGFWQECALKQRGMFLSQKSEIIQIFNSFKNDSEIILVKDKEDILAGILVIYSGEVAYYMYAASSSRGKNKYAPTLAAWLAIKSAKKKGCKLFDFEGIYDERFPVKSWLGFSRFKMSFNGKVVEYPGAYSKSFGLLSFFDPIL